MNFLPKVEKDDSEMASEVL